MRGRPQGVRLWSHARLDGSAAQSAAAFGGNVRLLDEDGTVVVELLGLRGRGLDRDAVATLVRPGTIPKTTSGKIQRQASRAGFLAGSLQPWGCPGGSEHGHASRATPAPPAQIFRDREPAT